MSRLIAVIIAAHLAVAGAFGLYWFERNRTLRDCQVGFDGAAISRDIAKFVNRRGEAVHPDDVHISHFSSINGKRYFRYSAGGMHGYGIGNDCGVVELWGDE